LCVEFFWRFGASSSLDTEHLYFPLCRQKVSRNQREIAFPLAKAVPGNLRAVLPTFPVFRTFSHVLQLQFSRFSHFFTPLHIFFGDSHAFLLFFRGQVFAGSQGEKPSGNPKQPKNTSVGGPRKSKKNEKYKN